MGRRPLAVYAVLYMAFLYAPIALLPIFAFNDSTVIAFPLDGATTRWFEELSTEPELRGALVNSLIVAAISAALATLLGICAARASTRHAFRGQRAIMGGIMLPLVLPEIIVAVALLVAFIQLGLGIGLWAVVAGHVLICTPFAIAILSGAFGALDPAMEEAAQDLGAGRWEAFRTVTLPLVMPAVISSALISFIISLDEFIIAFFLTGAEPTLPVYIWSQFRFPAKVPVVMALGTILVAASVVLLIVAELFRRRGLARSGRQDAGGFL